MQRRRFLGSVGAASALGLAGCSELGGTGTPEDGDDGGVGYELQSDRIYRERPVRTDSRLILAFTYAVGDTGYRFRDADGEETMLFPGNGWFLKTTVNWTWEADIPADWSLDPGAFRMVVDGQQFEPLSGLPRDIEWADVLGQPASIPPHFAAGPMPSWDARQGLLNLLFDTPADPSAPYYLRWDPSSPVDGSTEPVYLTSTYGPFERGEATGEG